MRNMGVGAVVVVTWIVLVGNGMTLTSNVKFMSHSLLDRSGGILYRTSVVSSKEEWDIIYQEVMRTLPFLQPESKSSIAQHRMGIALSSQNSPTVQLLRDPNSSITKYVNRIATRAGQEYRYEYVLAPEIPVEIRSYEKKNANMNWHIDDILYQPVPQIEIILTIINTSNCQTLWQIHDTVHGIETDPNSLLCLRAGVTSHCVTPLSYGSRTILKCAYIPRGNVTAYMHPTVDTTTKVSTKQFQSITRIKKYNQKQS